MAFDSLSEKLQNVSKNLRSKGKLTEDDVKAALKEVKMHSLRPMLTSRLLSSSQRVFRREQSDRMS